MKYKRSSTDRTRRERIDKQIKGTTFKSDVLERVEEVQRVIERAEIKGQWDDTKMKSTKPKSHVKHY